MEHDSTTNGASSAASPERVAIVGGGAIACGLAVTAAAVGDVVLVARSDASARRAGGRLERVCERLGDDGRRDHIRIEHDLDAVAGSTFVIETVLEDLDVKRKLLRALGRASGSEAVIGTSTSSLSVEALGRASGEPGRFVGFHPFNPVPKMKLLEVVFPSQATAQTRARTRALGEALGKTVVEVPDRPGFVVNRLLFPYLFGAVDLLERSDMEPSDVDTCMTLGAGHPMGPLALLDYVGLDVAEAIGQAIGVTVPPRVSALVAEGALGKKSGRGFYTYKV